MSKAIKGNEMIMIVKRQCPTCKGQYTLKQLIAQADKRGSKDLTCPHCKRNMGSM